MTEWLLGNIGDLIVKGFYSLMISIVEGLGQAAAMMFSWVAALAFEITDPDLGQGFVALWGSRLFTISLPIIVALAGAQLALAAVRTGGELHGAGYVLRGAVGAIFGTAIALPVLKTVNSAIDGIANGLLRVMLGDSQEALDVWASQFRLSDYASWETITTEFVDNPTTSTLTAPGIMAMPAAAGGVLLLVALAAIAGIVASAVLIIVLGIRSVLLYIAVVMVPIIFMGMVHKRTSQWVVKWGGIVFALMISKLAIVVILGIGVSAMASVVHTDNLVAGVGNMLVSSACMIVACMAPKAAMSFFGFMAGEVQAAQLESSVTSGATGATRTAASEVSRLSQGAARVGSGAAMAGASAATGGAAAVGMAAKAVTSGAQKLGSEASEVTTNAATAPSSASSTASAPPAGTGSTPVPPAGTGGGSGASSPGPDTSSIPATPLPVPSSPVPADSTWAPGGVPPAGITPEPSTASAPAKPVTAVNVSTPPPKGVGS